jgi:hypothetical protein
MTLTLDLPPELEKKLRERATASGQDVAGYLYRLIEREVLGTSGGEAPAASTGKTFDQILAPIREGFQQSGMTEEELTALFEEAREEVWQEKQRKGGP